MSFFAIVISSEDDVTSLRRKSYTICRWVHAGSIAGSLFLARLRALEQEFGGKTRKRLIEHILHDAWIRGSCYLIPASHGPSNAALLGDYSGKSRSIELLGYSRSLSWSAFLLHRAATLFSGDLRNMFPVQETRNLSLAQEICFSTKKHWKIHVYDSLAHNSEDNLGRAQTLAPVTHLLPSLMLQSGYFKKLRGKPITHPFSVNIMPADEQYVQNDTHSCGVIACMYVQRMLGNVFPKNPTNEYIENYRKKMTIAIFALGKLVD
ncbi:queuosine biosynthesis protein QueD [Striga asiatica]|uniref:Queuosine biosynthesis protein QueD n=1 Tax=Striga asiatica TaxID=4170 RepID=A0A5A7PM09_STRAF|nr:queuosine biosynthesis protein QueD [Striga asiatica]